MLDFRILVHPFLLNSTKDELTVLAVALTVIVIFSLAAAKKEIRKRRSGNDK